MENPGSAGGPPPRRPVEDPDAPEDMDSDREKRNMKRVEYVINGRPYAVDILACNGSTAQVRVNGKDYRVEIQQSLSAPSAIEASTPSTVLAPSKPGPVPSVPPPIPPSPKPAPAISAPPPAAKPEEAFTGEAVCAPMPGIILSVLVDEGQVVAAGDPLLVLEAMKMENEIHAPRAGMVKKILVREGSDVRQGTPLIELA